MATVEADVVPGVHRIEHAHANLYLLAGEDGSLTMIDTGLPGVWRLQSVHAAGHVVLHLPERDALVTDAVVVLPGYGRPFRTGIADADLARKRGAH